MEHESDGDTNCSWCTWNGPQRPEKETGGGVNKKKGRTYSIQTATFLRSARIIR